MTCKKIVKRVSALVILIIAGCFLSGCSMIDEMRSQQGFYKGDFKETIIFFDKEYKLIDIELEFEYSSDVETIFVTASDVPVLLSTTYGDLCYISADGEIIYRSDYSKDSGKVIDKYYVDVDVYEKYKDFKPTEKETLDL